MALLKQLSLKIAIGHFVPIIVYKIHINNCVEGKISECLFDTAHKTPSALVVLYRMLTIFACYVLTFMFGMLFLILIFWIIFKS